MNNEWSFTDEQMAVMKQQLQADGYESVEEWMLDSDYHFEPEIRQNEVGTSEYKGLTGDWYQNDDENSGPYDPWTQFYWAKEAENED